ncbi:hypothetical protein PI125_g20447 [Phytophthora idaei]|nr:hypothetical protein PI125_g20447 [Phytophthora idaei]
MTPHHKLLQKAEQSPSTSYNELARWAKVAFSLLSLPGKATISRVPTERVGLLRQPCENLLRKKKPSPYHLQLDESVVEFIMLAELEGICLSTCMIIFYATELAKKLRIPRHHQPRFGHSWLRCLQHWYDFRWRRAYGKSTSVDLTAREEQLAKIKSTVSRYTPRNVFNMDESAFFYKAVPRGSICKKSAPSLKQDKVRVTMACCANADGSEKLPLLFLGTAERPRWYKNKPKRCSTWELRRGVDVSAVVAWCR